MDIKDELAAAVVEDHGCDDLSGCDIARSLHEGFVFTSAWLLTGATETPTIGAVLERYPDVKLHPVPSDFDEWKEWHDENKVRCPECEHIMYDKGGPCSNCGKPMPAACEHSWVAGMMYVHPEDLDAVAAMRSVECERCDEVYTVS